MKDKKHVCYEAFLNISRLVRMESNGKTSACGRRRPSCTQVADRFVGGSVRCHYRNGRPHVLAFPEPVNTYVDELRQFDHLPKRIHPEIPPDIPLKQSFYIEDYWPGSVLNSAYPKAIVFPEPRLEKPGTPTLIEAVSPAEGLRRLVELNWPDRLPWGFNGFFDMMRDLAEQTPCYTIRWGDSLEDVPGKIGELLDGRVEGWKGGVMR